MYLQIKLKRYLHEIYTLATCSTDQLASSEYWLWKVFLKIFIQIKFTMIDKHYLIKNY